MQSFWTRFLLVVAVAQVGLAAAAWIPPPDSKTSPATSWTGWIPSADPRGIDVVDYDLDIEFTSLPPATGRLSARAVITLDLLDPIPAVIRLDLVNQLTVTSLLLDHSGIDWSHAGDTLRVALPAGAAAGERHRVEIRYEGAPPRHGPFMAGLLSRPHGDDNDQPTVGNVSQPYSSHSWFPCKDHPADKATLTMSVIVPDTLTVSATGRLLGIDDLDDDRQRWRWRSDHQVAPYLVGIAVSNFASWHEDCPCAEGVTSLDFHVFPEHLTIGQTVFAPTCDMLQWYENLAGPYPFTDEKYAQAEFGWAGAMENQTVTAFGITSLMMETRTAQLTVVHELSHHWFGNTITPRHWRDIWLNEGFARYTEALWIEHTEGEQAYLDYMALLAHDHLFLGDGLLGDPDPVLPNFLVYDKGAWVLHMLRRHLGDTRFFHTLYTYATHPDLREGHTDRGVFTAVWSDAAGEDLAPFLAPWLDTEASPELGVRWRALDNHRTLVEVVQKQRDPQFVITVPIRVFSGRLVQNHDIRLDDLVGSVTVTMVAPIDSVLIDPDGWLLNRTASTPAPRLLAAVPRPNPGVDSIALAYWLAASDRVSGTVYDVRGRLVTQVDLGVQQATGSHNMGGEPRVWSWNGVDGQGRRVAAGIYWLELRTLTERTVRKVTLLR